MSSSYPSVKGCPPEKNCGRLVSFGNKNLGRFGLRRACLRHVNAEKAIRINGLGLAQVKSWRQLQHALERPIADLHHEKTAVRRSAAIGTVAGDAETAALDRDLEILALHAGQFHLDDEIGVGDVDVRVGDPAAIGRVTATADGRSARDKMDCGADFSYGHVIWIIPHNACRGKR